MLTCEQIAEQARGISPIITKDNYEAIADQIHPHTPRERHPRQLTEGERIILVQLPEAGERRRAETWLTVEDWTDMVVARVAGSQLNTVVNAVFAAIASEDPMNTGIPATPAYQEWKAAMLDLILAHFPTQAYIAVVAAPWLEGFEDRHQRTPDDMARWLVEAASAAQGQQPAEEPNADL